LTGSLRALLLKGQLENKGGLKDPEGSPTSFCGYFEGFKIKRQPKGPEGGSTAAYRFFERVSACQEETDDRIIAQTLIQHISSILVSPEPVVVTQEKEEDKNTTSSYGVNTQTSYQDWTTLRVFDETSQRELTPDEELLVKQVSDQLSQALENARLFQEAQRFKLGIDTTDNAVFITDPNGVIQYTNPGFEKLYGYKSEEA